MKKIAAPFFACLFWISACKKSSSHSDSPGVEIPTANSIVYCFNTSGKLYGFDATTGQVKWSHSYEGSFASSNYSMSPGFSNGTLFMPTMNGYLYAVDALTGEQKWKYANQFTNGFYSSPFVVDNRLYTSDGLGVYAINPATGDLLWQSSSFYPLAGVSVAVDNGNLYAFGWMDGGLYSFDAASGAAKGRIGDFSNNNGGSPVIKSGVYYNTGLLSGDVSSHTTGLWVLSASDGQSLGGRQGYNFGMEPGHVIYCSSPTVSDSIVYASSDSTLYAVNTFQTGQETAPDFNLTWKYKMQGIFKASPTIDDSAVYSFASDGNLYKLDKKKGGLLWISPYASGQPSLANISSPVVANGIVYFASSGGVWAVLAENGQVVWHSAVSETFWDAPTVLAKDGKVFQCAEVGTVN